MASRRNLFFEKSRRDREIFFFFFNRLPFSVSSNESELRTVLRGSSVARPPSDYNFFEERMSDFDGEKSKRN